MVHKNAQHPAEAIKFLKYLTSEASQITWASGQMSPVAGVSEEGELDERTQAMLALMSGAPAIVPPDPAVSGAGGRRPSTRSCGARGRR